MRLVWASRRNQYVYTRGRDLRADIASKIPMVDIHQYNRRLEGALERVKKSCTSKANKEALLNFQSYCLATGIGAGKLYRYLDDMLYFSKVVKKDFKEFERKDIEKLMIALEQSKYSEWTKYSMKVALRKFFTWLRGKDEIPEEVRWVKLRMKTCNSKIPEELITEEEMKKLILAASKPRDKALISVLYESGCRISEILTMRIKHVAFDNYGAVITVSGKTGSRRVRLVLSVNYLQEWMNKNPQNENPEAFVWISRYNDLMSYGRVRDILADLAKKAGIKKRVNPHSFRHSRASFLANHLTESQLKEVFGWTQASRMASVYVHLSGRNTDQAILKVYGKVIEHEVKGGVLLPKACPRCKTENEATNKFCKLCGIPLDTETQHQLIVKEAQQTEANNLMNTLLKDKDVIALLTQKLKEISA